MASLDDWNTVRRRKHIRSKDLTSFFVGNLPEKVCKEDLKNLFEEYGKVADVFIAKKKDRSGSNFGFVKFMGVEDAKKLECSFKRMIMGKNVLTINIARYQRKAPIMQPMNRFPNIRSNHISPPSSAWNIKGTKTYANAVSGSVNPGKPAPLSINLNPSTVIDNTLFSSFLFGELIDFASLKALPCLLKNAGIKFGKIFYYGGLCVLIGFDEEVDASGFLGKNDCWKTWFSWLKRGDSIKNWRFERIIDVKIVGLPLQFRSLENFTKILSHHGKILEMGDDNVWKFEDLSYVNICLLTNSKIRINEEIIIEYEKGIQFTIGVVEDGSFNNIFMEDVWIENDDQKCMDQDNISDTYRNNTVNEIPPEVEEGEILPDIGANNDLRVNGDKDSSNAKPFGLNTQTGPFPFSFSAKSRSNRGKHQNIPICACKPHVVETIGNRRKRRRYQDTSGEDVVDPSIHKRVDASSIDLNRPTNSVGGINESNDVSQVFVFGSQECKKQVGFQQNVDDEVLKDTMVGNGV